MLELREVTDSIQDVLSKGCNINILLEGTMSLSKRKEVSAKDMKPYYKYHDIGLVFSFRMSRSKRKGYEGDMLIKLDDDSIKSFINKSNIVVCDMIDWEEKFGTIEDYVFSIWKSNVYR